MKTPLATAGLVAANLMAFQAELAGGGIPVCEAYGLVPARVEPATVLSSMFLHDPRTLIHLSGNLVFLAIFGAIVEGVLGSMRLLVLYLVAGVAGGLLHVGVDPTSTTALVGASGAVFGILAVAGALRPGLLGFVVAFGAIEIWHAFAGGAESVSFGCHLGGLAAGAIFAVLWRDHELVSKGTA